LNTTYLSLARFLIKSRWYLLVVGCALTALSIIPATKLDFDRRIERLFAEDDPLLLNYVELKENFGGNLLVLAVYEDPELFASDGSGIHRLAKIRRSLEEVQGVSSTLSLDQIFGDFATLNTGPVGRLRRLFEGYTHGADERTSCVLCMLDPSLDSEQMREQTITEIRQRLRELPDGLADGIAAGEPVMMVDAYRYIERDGQWLSLYCTILAGLVILLTLRSPRWVVIALLVIHAALIWTKATFQLAGFHFSLISGTMTAMVTVIGVASTIHLLVHYKENLREGQDPTAALTIALQKLLAPMFFASATDAVGFLALGFASVAPIREYGIMMAIGAMGVFLSTLLFVPAIALWGVSKRLVTVASHAPVGMTWPQRVVQQVTQRPGRVVTVGVLIGVVSAIGFVRLETETDFTRNFRSDTPLVQSYQMIETKLGGAGIFDVTLPAPAKLDYEFLVSISELENELRQNVTVDGPDGVPVPALTKVISLSDVVVAGSPKKISKVRRIFRQTVISLALGVLERRIPDFVEALYTPPLEDGDGASEGNRLYRIMLRTVEQQGTSQKVDIIRQVREICQAHTPEAEVTGFFVLLTNIVVSMMQDQWTTMTAALIGIWLVTTIAFRSPGMAVLGLVPNVVPIALVMGAMGWLDLKINLGGAMIAAVSLGLSIDSSVHFIHSFQRDRAAGRSVDEAIHEAGGTVGRAMVFATLALIAGFVTLCFSPFVPTIYFGTLVSMAMLGGLIGNLVVLPALIKLTHH